MRTPSPSKTHRPKDFCTIEQAEYIANLVCAHREHVRSHSRWHRRLRRSLATLTGRLLVALRFSRS